MKQETHAGTGGITWTQWVTGEEKRVTEKGGVKQGECERSWGRNGGKREGGYGTNTLHPYMQLPKN